MKKENLSDAPEGKKSPRELEKSLISSLKSFARITSIRVMKGEHLPSEVYQLPHFAIPSGGSSEERLEALRQNTAFYGDVIAGLRNSRLFKKKKIPVEQVADHSISRGNQSVRRIYTKIGDFTGYIVEEATLEDDEPIDFNAYFKTPVEAVEHDLRAEELHIESQQRRLSHS